MNRTTSTGMWGRLAVTGWVWLALAVAPAIPENVGPLGKTRVAFSPRGDALELILDELRQAKQSVDVAMFYLSNDTLIDALAWVTERGQVRVTIYVDEEMAKAAHRPTLNRLSALGATIYVEELAGNGKLHLKTMVIDKRKVVTGSSNWTQTAFAANCEDTLVLESPALAEYYLERFAWLEEQSTLFEGESHAEEAPDKYPSAPKMTRTNKDTRLVAPRVAAFFDVRACDPHITPGRRGIDQFIRLAGQATRSIDIGIYYISDPAVIEALCGAARTRGVRVRIIADDIMLSGSRLAHLQTLYEAGVDMYYLDNSTASLHMKSAVLDERLVFLGSHNWTPSAAEKNMEDILLIDSRRMAQHYTRFFEYLIAKHATHYEAIEREAVEETDDGRMAFSGLRKAGEVIYPDSLARTGPRKSFTDILDRREVEPIRATASVEYLDDEQYLPVLEELIRTANQSILVSMYHLAAGVRAKTVDRVLDSLGEAAERGIYVYMVLNMPSNPSDSQHEMHSGIAERLRQRGVDVRLNVPAVDLHEKTVVVDLSKILVGSHNWSEGAITGEGVYESGALVVLDKQDPRFARHILQHAIVSDMRDREKWESELSLLRHVSSLKQDERDAYIRELEAQR